MPKGTDLKGAELGLEPCLISGFLLPCSFVSGHCSLISLASLSTGLSSQSSSLSACLTFLTHLPPPRFSWTAHMCYIFFFPKTSETRSVVSDSLRPRGLYTPWNSPGQNTGMGNLSLLEGIFPTQGSNPGLPHCRQILCQLSYEGSLFPKKYSQIRGRGPWWNPAPRDSANRPHSGRHRVGAQPPPAARGGDVAPVA